MRTAILLIALTFAAPALAQNAPPDPVRGRLIAQHWCVSCHVIDKATPGGDAGPSFPSVINKLGRSEDELRGWLSDPHPPMPRLNLSSIEIDDLLAHILSLKN